MSILNVFDVSGSAMSAQTVRLNTTASNLANAQSVASSVDETYRSRQPVFSSTFADALDQRRAPASGVEVLGIVESEAPLDMRYEPSHPMADEQGYVAYPNVNVVEEMANMISASRAFELNVDMMSSAKSLAEQLLRLGQ